MQSKVFTTTKDSLTEACKNALKSLGMSVKSVSKDGTVITAETSISFFSWGSVIELQITSDCWYLFSLTVASKDGQVISWGTNDGHEANIINEITKILYNHETFCLE